MANPLIETLKEVSVIIAALTPFGLAFMVYKQNQLSKKQDKIQEQTDGKMNQLLEVSKASSLKQGQLEGLAAVDAKELVKAIDYINGDHPTAEPTEVKIVDQTKPVDVKQKK